MPDDHSKLVPLLPIPNRTVKRLCADDSADSRVKVGHRQALTAQKRPTTWLGVFFRASIGVLKKAQKRAIIQGSADHSGVREKDEMRGAEALRILLVDR